MSRLVTMPTSLLPILPLSVMGIPVKPYFAFTAATSATMWAGPSVIGSKTNPC